jgi:hypothetical protein
MISFHIHARIAETYELNKILIQSIFQSRLKYKASANSGRIEHINSYIILKKSNIYGPFKYDYFEEDITPPLFGIKNLW